MKELIRLINRYKYPIIFTLCSIALLIIYTNFTSEIVVPEGSSFSYSGDETESTTITGPFDDHEEFKEQVENVIREANQKDFTFYVAPADDGTNQDCPWDKLDIDGDPDTPDECPYGLPSVSLSEISCVESLYDECQSSCEQSAESGYCKDSDDINNCLDECKSDCKNVFENGWDCNNRCGADSAKWSLQLGFNSEDECNLYCNEITDSIERCDNCYSLDALTTECKDQCVQDLGSNTENLPDCKVRCGWAFQYNGDCLNQCENHLVNYLDELSDETDCSSFCAPKDLEGTEPSCTEKTYVGTIEKPFATTRGALKQMYDDKAEQNQNYIYCLTEKCTAEKAESTNGYHYTLWLRSGTYTEPMVISAGVGWNDQDYWAPLLYDDNGIEIIRVNYSFNYIEEGKKYCALTDSDLESSEYYVFLEGSSFKECEEDGDCSEIKDEKCFDVYDKDSKKKNVATNITISPYKEYKEETVIFDGKCSFTYPYEICKEWDYVDENGDQECLELYISDDGPINPDHEEWSSNKTVMDMKCETWADDENPDGDYINTGMVHVEGGNFITIKDLSVVNSPNEAISIRGQSSYIILSRNNTEQSYSSSLYIKYDVSNAIIENNTFAWACAGSVAENTTISRSENILLINNAYGETYNDAGIDPNDESSDIAIIGNTMSNVLNGVYIAGKNIKFSSNIIHGSQRAITIASETGDPVSNIEINNNMISDSSKSGIWLGQYCDSGRSTSNCENAITENVFITNNTFVSNYKAIQIDRTENQDGEYKNIHVKNNIISQGDIGVRLISINDSYTGEGEDEDNYKLTVPEMLGSEIFIENNLKWCTLDYDYTTTEYSSTQDINPKNGINDCFHYATVFDTTGSTDEYIEYVNSDGEVTYNSEDEERTDLYINPQFVHTADGIFRIDQNSPAYNKAISLSDGFEEFDFESDSRYGDCFDIGADEYGYVMLDNNDGCSSSTFEFEFEYEYEYEDEDEEVRYNLPSEPGLELSPQF